MFIMIYAITKNIDAPVVIYENYNLIKNDLLLTMVQF